MKKSFVITLCLSLVLVLSLSIVSAGWAQDVFWGNRDGDVQMSPGAVAKNTNNGAVQKIASSKKSSSKKGNSYTQADLRECANNKLAELCAGAVRVTLCKFRKSAAVRRQCRNDLSSGSDSGDSNFVAVVKKPGTETVGNVGKKPPVVGNAVKLADFDIKSCYSVNSDWIEFNEDEPFRFGENVPARLVLSYNYVAEEDYDREIYARFYDCPDTFNSDYVSLSYLEDGCKLIDARVPITLSAEPTSSIPFGTERAKSAWTTFVAAGKREIWATYSLTGKREFVSKDYDAWNPEAPKTLKPKVPAEIEVVSVDLRFEGCDEYSPSDDEVCYYAYAGKKVTPVLTTKYKILNNPTESTKLKLSVKMRYNYGDWMYEEARIIESSSTGNKPSYVIELEFPKVTMIHHCCSGDSDVRSVGIVEVDSDDGWVGRVDSDQEVFTIPYSGEFCKDRSCKKGSIYPDGGCIWPWC